MDTHRPQRILLALILYAGLVYLSTLTTSTIGIGIIIFLAWACGKIEQRIDTLYQNRLILSNILREIEEARARKET